MSTNEGEKPDEDVKERMTVEDIGDVVRESGFKAEKEEYETALGLLSKLSEFMAIEAKNGQTAEDQINSLQRQGIISKEQAKNALAKAVKAKKDAGGVNYDEDNRKSINFSRTTVKHVIRLLDAIGGE